MRYSAIALAAAAAVVPAFVSAQSTTHNVTVGSNGQLLFEPASLTANVGETVTFTFTSKNHSVFQSTFADPCTRSNINGTAGFASEFHLVNANDSNVPTFIINVTSTDAIWFYCAQKIPVDHCAMGMVGVINPTQDKTLDDFKAKAMSTGNSSTAPSGTASGTGASASPTNGAIQLSSSAAAGLVTFLGLMAGLAL